MYFVIYNSVDAAAVLSPLCMTVPSKSGFIVLFLSVNQQVKICMKLCVLGGGFTGKRCRKETGMSESVG